MRQVNPGRGPASFHFLHSTAARVAGATLLATSSACFGQSVAAPNALDPVVVTATRVPQSLSDTLPSTTVISRADIENSEEQDVLSLLRRVAGVEFAQSGGLGSQASIFMRGANSNQTLVLIDGIPANQVESGGSLLQHLMLSQVDHIEVVRGNVSALYGSQAVGGVIQIFTRAAGMAPGAALDVQGGGDHTGNLAASAATVMGSAGTLTHAAVSVSANTMGGFPAINPAASHQANPADDTYRNASLSASLSQQIGDQEVRLRVLDSYARLEFDDPTDYSYLMPGYDGRLYSNMETSHVSSANLEGLLHLSELWSAQLRVGQQNERTIDSSSFDLSSLIGTTQSRTDQYAFDNTFRIAPQQIITAGVEFVDESGNSSAYGREFTRRVDSLLAGYVGTFGDHQFQANVRSDDYSDFGSTTSGLLAYGYHFAEHYKVIAQLSNAFDAPTFDDLFYPGASNPDLKPELSRSAELGLEYANTGFSGRVSAYQTEVRDLIEFNPVTFIPENIAHARLTGLEWSGNLNWQEWIAYANLTLQRPIDSDTDQLLLRRATHNVNLGVARRFGPWYFAVDVTGAGARYDDDINTFARISLPGYSITNLVARYALDARTTLSVSLHNAFDRHYELVDGYNTPGRVLLAGMSVRL